MNYQIFNADFVCDGLEILQYNTILLRDPLVGTGVERQIRSQKQGYRRMWYCCCRRLKVLNPQVSLAFDITCNYYSCLCEPAEIILLFILFRKTIFDSFALCTHWIILKNVILTKSSEGLVKLLCGSHAAHAIVPVLFRSC